MMDSISKSARRRLIDEGRRLHMAIVEWGRKHGVWAYRVMPSQGRAYFEIYNPKTKSCSHDFPAKIGKAIADHAEALSEYEAWSRSSDCTTPRGQVLSKGIERSLRHRQDGHTCDCNGEMRSASPIKRDIDMVQTGSDSQTELARYGSANRRKVDFLT